MISDDDDDDNNNDFFVNFRSGKWSTIQEVIS